MAELLELHMAQADLFAWNMEDDPLLRSTIVAVATQQASDDVDELMRSKPAVEGAGGAQGGGCGCHRPVHTTRCCGDREWRS